MRSSRLSTEDYADEITVDTVGNVICTKRGARTDGLEVMVDAHTDEPALNVKYIEDTGFVRLEYVSLPLLQALPFERVDIHGKRGSVLSVVGAPGFHVYFMEMGGPKGPEKPERLRDLFVDVGAGSRKEAEDMGIYIGAPITFHRNVETLGGNLITGKALDNRALCAVGIEGFRRLKDFRRDATIHLVGTVQEEVALRGTRIAAFRLNPDMAIVLDVTIPGDYPGVEFRDFPLKLGGGECIGIKDMAWDFGLGNLAHPKIIQLMTKTRRTHTLSTREHYRHMYQCGEHNGNRKGDSLRKDSVPTRYTHTGSEVLSLDDLESATKLLIASLTRVDENFSLDFL